LSADGEGGVGFGEQVEVGSAIAAAQGSSNLEHVDVDGRLVAGKPRRRLATLGGVAMTTRWPVNVPLAFVSTW